MKTLCLDQLTEIERTALYKAVRRVVWDTRVTYLHRPIDFLEGAWKTVSGEETRAVEGYYCKICQDFINPGTVESHVWNNHPEEVFEHLALVVKFHRQIRAVYPRFVTTPVRVFPDSSVEVLDFPVEDHEAIPYDESALYYICKGRKCRDQFFRTTVGALRHIYEQHLTPEEVLRFEEVATQGVIEGKVGWECAQCDYLPPPGEGMLWHVLKHFLEEHFKEVFNDYWRSGGGGSK